MSETKLRELREALLYMRMEELRETCEQLDLPTKGVKQTLVERIVHFLKSGTILKELPIPATSRATRGTSYPLAPETLIVYGSYKNDAATRAFMKTLVGSHFHFTAAGIDWIKGRWLAGDPPTYREFAQFWEQSQSKKLPPKQEWAYINFTQRYVKEYRAASHGETIEAWMREQSRQVARARRLIQDCLLRTTP